MAPVRPKKRQSSASPSATQTIPTKTGTTTKTPHNRSPIKKRRKGITLAQKQAIIENLQLEITERARRLRAQYNQQAQSLRSRIEIRVNRIPTSLRRLTMGELLQKYIEQQERPAPVPGSRAPPVPAKDLPRMSPQKTHAPIYHPLYMVGRRMSHDELAGPDKENEGSIDNPKKRHRGPAGGVAKELTQVLSPTSSNSRLGPRGRPASPAKSQIARPASPVKPAPSRGAANMLSSMVEKAKATRAGVGRKATTTSTTSSSSAATSMASTTRAKRAAATNSKTAAAMRNTRRASGVSNSSNDSTSTVVKKTAAARGTAASTTATQKRTMMGTLKKGTTGGTATKKTTAKAAAGTTGTTRVLRKRT